VDDGRADLALDIVADQRQPGRLETPAPGRVRGDEHRDAVDERTAGLDCPLGIEPRCPLRTDRQIRDQHLGAALPQYAGDIRRWQRRLDDFVREILPDAVERRSAFDLDAEPRHLGEELGVVRGRQNRLGGIEPDLGAIDVESGADRHVAHPVAANVAVHQSRDRHIVAGVTVIGEALDQGRGAVPDADDADPHAARLFECRIHARFPRCGRAGLPS
jgi:hypothetical protein